MKLLLCRLAAEQTWLSAWGHLGFDVKVAAFASNLLS